ncbi:hypothetical protein GC173_18870 [bacterium]|nr:hypothetical protein [bacterium]
MMRSIRVLGGALAFLFAATSSAVPAELIFDRVNEAIAAIEWRADGTLDYKEVRSMGRTYPVRVYGWRAPDGTVALVQQNGPIPPLGADVWATCMALRQLSGDTWAKTTKGDWDDAEKALRLPNTPDRAAFELILSKADLTTASGVVWLRLPDPSCLTVIEAAQEKNWDKVGVLLAELCPRYPDSAFLQLAHLDLFLIQDDGEGLRDALKSGAQKLEASPVTLLREAPRYYGACLQAWDDQKDGKNLAAVVTAAYSPADGSHPSREQMRAALRHLGPESTVTVPSQPLVLRSFSFPNFLSYQTAVKVDGTEADFALLNGEPDKAVELMSGHAWLGMALGRSDATLIGDLIGVAVQAIAIRHLELAYMNGYTSTDALAAQWPLLDSMWKSAETLNRGPRGWEPFVGMSEPAPRDSDHTEVSVRTKTVFAKWGLLHSGVAVRHEVLRTGSFPGSTSALGSLMPQGADADPFDKSGARLRSAINSPNGPTATLYSVGPDERDGFGRIEYDPTNGIVSSGDITLTIRRDRKYPFPVGEAPPKTVEEILARYPKGLPSDTFCDYRGASYIMSRTSPPVIWSVGPDVDAAEWVLTQPVYPDAASVPKDKGLIRFSDGTWRAVANTPDQPPYDPTNGTISEGNLYAPIPR